MGYIAQDGGGRPHAVVLINPSKVDRSALSLALASAEHRLGWGPTVWRETKKSRPLDRADILASGPAVVLVAGGDGTVRRTVAALLGTEVPLGIIPSGTGNLLARELHLPLSSLEDALAIALGAEERRLDVIELETESAGGARRRHVSVVLSGVGIDAAMIANTQPHLKRRFGWLAYVDGVRRSLHEIAPFHVEITVDGVAVRCRRAMAVLVANLADLPGRLSLAPGTAIDDGELDVIVVQPKRLIDWLFIWRRVSWENGFLRKFELGAQLAELSKGRRRNQLVYRRGRSVRISLGDEAQAFQIDGDPAGQVRQIRAAVHPVGVRVRAPQPLPVVSQRSARASRAVR
ncbi:MAG TPA: diacylglycerol kinase family protein [Microbacteriaceae bacterium]|nr:diacylglycerol kinase family protein [Microbacteriaceae bacterium]